MNNHDAALFKDKQMGFFIYLGVEAIMFLTLFTTYMIYTPASTGPHPTEVFKAKSLIISSFFLLSSSGTLFFSEKGLKKGNKKKLLIGLEITLLFGATFLGLSIHEFYKYVVIDGHGLSSNVFMGSFYVLVVLHASHVAFGVGWMIILLFQHTRNLPHSLFTEKYTIFSYYWHFVDIIWVFIIVIVYLPYLI